MIAATTKPGKICLDAILAEHAPVQREYLTKIAKVLGSTSYVSIELTDPEKRAIVEEQFRQGKAAHKAARAQVATSALADMRRILSK